MEQSLPQTETNRPGRRPFQVTFRDVRRSPGIVGLIDQKVQQLAAHCTRMTSCDVLVERPRKGQRSGIPFRVRVTVGMPGKNVVIDREPAATERSDNLPLAIGTAFRLAQRQLDETRSRKTSRHRRRA